MWGLPTTQAPEVVVELELELDRELDVATEVEPIEVEPIEVELERLAVVELEPALDELAPEVAELSEVTPVPLDVARDDVPAAELDPPGELPDRDPDAPAVEPEAAPVECDPDVASELDAVSEPELPLSEESPVDDEHAANAAEATISNGRERALMMGCLLLSRDGV